MYAYDGSGKVTRDKNNYSVCTFTTGKRYNCDLSASYNIGARYFLRAYKKSMSETAWSELKAKVPELSKRITWTLNTLRLLHQAMKPFKDLSAVWKAYGRKEPARLQAGTCINLLRRSIRSSSLATKI